MNEISNTLYDMNRLLCYWQYRQLALCHNLHDINLFGLRYGTVQFKQCIIQIIVLMHITTVRVNWQRHTTHNSYNCLCVHSENRHWITVQSLLYDLWLLCFI